MATQRRNPDDLLQAVTRSEGSRGRLRVFLGMCPGVGKTYSMLKAAREQKKRGLNVAIGVVETHGRTETQELTEGLRDIGKKSIEYKGTTLLEMDIDRILSLRPDLVLVDELAHTNAPGSRHEKRYQDVQELIEAGLDVYTTLNIQHIESRNDQVAQITGVQVRETVPDSLLALADQVEVIDLSPSELLRRLDEGKVYLGDRAARAKDSFFKEEHLTALRELALRFTAEKVDQDLSDQMTMKGIAGPWNTNERLLVAIGYSPYSPRLIRTARRMAFNLEAPWIALYVDTGVTLSAEDEDMLKKNINLARELGAEVITFADHDIVGAIHRICRDKNVTQIIMGRPDRRMIQDFFSGGTLLDRLVVAASNVDIHVIRAKRKPIYRGLRLKWPQRRSGFFAYYNVGWFLLAVSLFCYGLVPYVGYQALGSVFLLAILVVATLTTRGPILFAGVACAIIWNFFFIPPTFSFSISSGQDIMMVLSFFVTSLVAGYLTTRIRRQEAVLQNREAQSLLLYEFVKALSDAQSTKDILLLLVETIQRQFGGEAAVVLAGKDKKLNTADVQGHRMNEKDLAVANWSFENGKPAGWSTQTLSASPCYCIPMKGNRSIVGVVAFYPQIKLLTIDKENFLDTVIAQTAIAIERLEFSEAAQTAHLYEASEKLHQALLNSVSHELRTPITALIGSASALKEDKTIHDPAARSALTDGLISSARRLDRVVENLLDMSRLEKGSLQLKKEWFDINDLLQLITADLSQDLNGRMLTTEVISTTLIEGDFKLLEHALLQITLNAIKYSTSGTGIEIKVSHKTDKILISICDHGPGIPIGLEDKIFEKFYRVEGTPTGGLGLGLSIVRTIVELHGGTVTARNRTDTTGSEFQVTLPLKAPPDILKEAIE